MTAGRVILWRHGQTDYNVGGRVQGQVDIPLNETGRAQALAGASALAEYLADRGPLTIVSSDLSRAAATAAALANLTGAETAVDPRLRERSFGAWEGLNREEIMEGWGSGPVEEWAAGGTPAGIGLEPNRDVARRVAEAVLAAARTLDFGGTLVAVGHGAALAHGALRLLGLDPEAGSPLRGLDNCHFTDLGHQPHRRPEWVLRGHNLGAQ